MRHCGWPARLRPRRARRDPAERGADDLDALSLDLLIADAPEISRPFRRAGRNFAADRPLAGQRRPAPAAGRAHDPGAAGLRPQRPRPHPAVVDSLAEAEKALPASISPNSPRRCGCRSNRSPRNCAGTRHLPPRAAAVGGARLRLRADRADPALSHGNWILLTIAVIFARVTAPPPSAATSGCSAPSSAAPSPARCCGPIFHRLLMAAQLSAVGIAHAFARVDYRLTSVAASVMALLGLHLLDPGETAPVASRLIDTAIGAAWPTCSIRCCPITSATGTAALGARFRQKARDLCRPRAALERVGAGLSPGAQGDDREFFRAGGIVQTRARQSGRGKVLAALQQADRPSLFHRRADRHDKTADPNRIDDLDPYDSAALLDDTRAAVMAQLRPACAHLPPSCEFYPDESDAFAALRLRCAEAAVEAERLRHLAARLGA